MGCYSIEVLFRIWVIQIWLFCFYFFPFKACMLLNLFIDYLIYFKVNFFVLYWSVLSYFGFLICFALFWYWFWFLMVWSMFYIILYCSNLFGTDLILIKWFRFWFLLVWSMFYIVLYYSDLFGTHLLLIYLILILVLNWDFSIFWFWYSFWFYFVLCSSYFGILLPLLLLHKNTLLGCLWRWTKRKYCSTH